LHLKCGNIHILDLWQARQALDLREIHKIEFNFA